VYSIQMTTLLSLTRAGSGEPLLLLHGLGSSRHDFTAMLHALTDRFDVINVDLPGIGRSPHLKQRPTVAAITDALELGDDPFGGDRLQQLIGGCEHHSHADQTWGPGPGELAPWPRPNQQNRP